MGHLFSTELILRPSRLAGLPDIVADGVLQGFYPRDVRVSFTASALATPDQSSSVEAWRKAQPSTQYSTQTADVKETFWKESLRGTAAHQDAVAEMVVFVADFYQIFTH